MTEQTKKYVQINMYVYIRVDLSTSSFLGKSVKNYHITLKLFPLRVFALSPYFSARKIRVYSTPNYRKL